MEPVFTSLKEYIDSGEYFSDARRWYEYKYIHPFSQRSFLFILSTIICALFIGIIININGLFPVIKQVKYSITADTGANKSAQVIRANQVNNEPLASITDILLRNYVIQRESYDYDNLKKQFIYIKNNSTRIVFRRFYSYMNIDNPSSPVLRYQKDIKKHAIILEANFINNTKAELKLRGIAKNSAGEIIEDTIWLATVDYEIDEINSNLPSGSRFNFTVSDYQLKLLEDKKKK